MQGSNPIGACSLYNDIEEHHFNDVYLLPGYSEKDVKGQLDAITVEMDDRRVFRCRLPYTDCDYDIPCIMDALDNQIHEHSGDSKVDLIGMSFGGMLSRFYAAEHPERVDKLALIYSFSKIHDPYKILRLTLSNTKHIQKILSYNMSENRTVSNPTLAINCLWDAFIMGDPPVIDNGDSITVTNCFHHHFFVPQEVRDEVKEFLTSNGL